MIYLSSPYTHKDPVIREYRYRYAECYLAERMKQGIIMFSPIVHSHNLSMRYELPKEFEYWMEIDKHFISLSNGIEVLKLDGWNKSKGVLFEIEFAKRINIPVCYVDTGNLILK